MRIHEMIWITLLAMVVGLLQSTFSSFLPFPWSTFQPAILCIVYFTLRGGMRKAILFSLVCGFFIDSFSSMRHDGVILQLFFVALPLSAIATSLLTNRSLYASIALDVFAHVVAWMFQFGFGVLMSMLRDDTLFHLPELRMTAASVAWDVVIIFCVYLIRALLSQRFVLTGKRHRYG